MKNAILVHWYTTVAGLGVGLGLIAKDPHNVWAWVAGVAAVINGAVSSDGRLRP